MAVRDIKSYVAVQHTQGVLHALGILSLRNLNLLKALSVCYIAYVFTSATQCPLLALYKYWFNLKRA